MEKIEFYSQSGNIRDFSDPQCLDYALMYELALQNRTITNLVDDVWYSEKLEDLSFEGFKKKGKLQYTIEMPIDPLQFIDNHLIVIFPGAGTILDNEVCHRMFGSSKFSPMSLMSKSVGKNTYILRIADTNLISGSYFWSTVNYPDYELEVQQLIDEIRDLYGVKHMDTVLWGESRGAVGALIHGFLGGYKTLSVDPIVNRYFFVDEDDYHYQFDLTPVDFVPKLNEYAKNTKADKADIIILTHHDSTIAFPYINQLDKHHVTILDLSYDLSVLKLTSPKAIHGFLIAKSVPLQLSIMNQLLLSSSVNEISTHLESDYYAEDFDSNRPIVSSFFNHRYREHFIEIYRNDKLATQGEWAGVEFRLKEILSIGQRYELSLELIGKIPSKIKFLMWSNTEKKIFEIGQPKIVTKSSRFGFDTYEYKYEFEAVSDYDRLYTSATFISIGESLKIRGLKINRKINN